MIDARQYIIGKYKPFDFEVVVVADSAIGLTASKLSASPQPKQAFITAESGQCRYRMDGTAPTSSVGHILLPMQSLLLEGYHQLNNFKAIRTGVQSANLSISYLR